MTNVKPGAIMSHVSPASDVVILAIGSRNSATRSNNGARCVVALLWTSMLKRWVIREWNTMDEAWQALDENTDESQRSHAALNGATR